MDDPRHGRQRRIVSRGFSPLALRKLEETVERRADAIIDPVIERGECDFVNDIAAPLPLEIIADMMGIPGSQIDMLRLRGPPWPRRRKVAKKSVTSADRATLSGRRS